MSLLALVSTECPPSGRLWPLKTVDQRRAHAVRSERAHKYTQDTSKRECAVRNQVNAEVPGKSLTTSAVCCALSQSGGAMFDAVTYAQSEHLGTQAAHRLTCLAATAARPSIALCAAAAGPALPALQSPAASLGKQSPQLSARSQCVLSQMTLLDRRATSSGPQAVPCTWPK
jgi:hypothetical protein